MSSYLHRYVVFAGDNYYPLRGFGDFKNSFEVLEKAKKFYRRCLEKFDWAICYDTYEVDEDGNFLRVY